MRENEYAVVERVFALWILLSSGSHTRAEIFEAIAAYGTTAHRMLERDLACLQRLGFQVMRERRGPNPAVYRIR